MIIINIINIYFIINYIIICVTFNISLGENKDNIIFQCELFEGNEIEEDEYKFFYF